MKIRYITFGSHFQNSQASNAAYNRMSLTCSGLNLHGINAEICEIYSVLFGKSLIHYFGHFICIFKTISILLSLKKDDVVIVYSENPYSFLFKFLHKRARLFAELHEYPAYLIHKSISLKAVRLSKSFEKNLIYFEGLIACSYELKRYYQNYTNRKCKYLVMPLLIDFKKFTCNSFEKEDYIGYCGDFGNNKDGVPALIEAFSIISNKHNNYKLILAGGTNDTSAINFISSLIHRFKLEDRVVLTGVLNHNQMPEFLGKASVLALARPDNLQAKGGFPSKVAEYLASGRPVVLTKVGELDKYLTDNVNVFFSDSDKSEDFADCLDRVLSNYPTAIKVGESGREIAESFDFYRQAEIINRFIQRE